MFDLESFILRGVRLRRCKEVFGLITGNCIKDQGAFLFSTRFIRPVSLAITIDMGKA